MSFNYSWCNFISFQPNNHFQIYSSREDWYWLGKRGFRFCYFYLGKGITQIFHWCENVEASNYLQCYPTHKEEIVNLTWNDLSLLYAGPLAPVPIRVQSCVCCLFWTNRNSMAVTFIFLSHYPVRDMNPSIGAITGNGNI